MYVIDTFVTINVATISSCQHRTKIIAMRRLPATVVCHDHTIRTARVEGLLAVLFNVDFTAASFCCFDLLSLVLQRGVAWGPSAA